MTIKHPAVEYIHSGVFCCLLLFDFQIGNKLQCAADIFKNNFFGCSIGIIISDRRPLCIPNTIGVVPDFAAIQHF